MGILFPPIAIVKKETIETAAKVLSVSPSMTEMAKYLQLKLYIKIGLLMSARSFEVHNREIWQ